MKCDRRSVECSHGESPEMRTDLRGSWQRYSAFNLGHITFTNWYCSLNKGLRQSQEWKTIKSRFGTGHVLGSFMEL